MAKKSKRSELKTKRSRHKAKHSAKRSVKKASLPAVTFPLMERRLLSVEKAMEKRFLDLEKKLAHLNAGVKMHDSPQATKVVFELPGFKKNDVSIEITDHTATVSASAKGASYYKAISLPFVVLPEKAKAKFKNGELTVVLPKLKMKVEKRGHKLKA